MRINSRFLIGLCLALGGASSFIAVVLAEDGLQTGRDQMQSVCQNISLSPANRSLTAEGGSAFINVAHETGCRFRATSNADWITITSTDSGTVYYSVQAYTGTGRRTGAIAVGSQSFPISQNAQPMQGAPDIVWTGRSHTASANAVAFSPDGQFLASASSDHSVKVWRVADGVLLQTLTGFFDSVAAVTFSHNGQMLAASSFDRNVKVWSVANWSLIRTIGITDFALGVSFSPDDANLAVAGGYSGNWIHILRTSDWQEIALLGYGQQTNTSIAYSPDGQLLAWSEFSGEVRLQNVNTGSFCSLFENTQYGYIVNSVAFSPNGQRLASASDSQAVSVWQVANCAALLSLNGPSGFVKSVAYAPNGKAVLSGGQDYGASRGTLTFWRISDGALLRVYIGETSTAVYAVQYSPLGDLFAYGREDGAVVVARSPL
jgi:WD40 repeat protein